MVTERTASYIEVLVTDLPLTLLLESEKYVDGVLEIDLVDLHCYPS